MAYYLSPWVLGKRVRGKPATCMIESEQLLIISDSSNTIKLFKCIIYAKKYWRHYKV